MRLNWDFLGVKDFLLLTRSFSIRAIDFNRDSNVEARPSIVPDQQTFITDSTFDYEQKTVYFYSQREQMIFSSKMDGEGKQFRSLFCFQAEFFNPVFIHSTSSSYSNKNFSNRQCNGI